MSNLKKLLNKLKLRKSLSLLIAVVQNFDNTPSTYSYQVCSLFHFSLYVEWVNHKGVNINFPSKRKSLKKRDFVLKYKIDVS